MKVSTGTVVSFRATDYLSSEFKDENSTVPILWMHNIKEMDVVWPFAIKRTKPSIGLELDKTGGFKNGIVLLETRNPLPIKKYLSSDNTLFDDFNLPNKEYSKINDRVEKTSLN